MRALISINNIAALADLPITLSAAKREITPWRKNTANYWHIGSKVNEAIS